MQVWIDGQHEYDIIKHTRTATIRRSKSNDWTNPGEYIGGVIDDGDGIEFDLPFLSCSVDYNQFNEMLALMMSIADSEFELKKTKTIKRL